MSIEVKEYSLYCGAYEVIINGPPEVSIGRTLSNSLIFPPVICSPKTGTTNGAGQKNDPDFTIRITLELRFAYQVQGKRQPH